MHEQVEKTVLSAFTAPLSGRESFFPGWVSSCQLSAVTVASSLMGRCGLSHEHVEDGCKGACVKLGGLKTRQNWGYGKFDSCVGKIYPVMVEVWLQPHTECQYNLNASLVRFQQPQIMFAVWYTALFIVFTPL